MSGATGAGVLARLAFQNAGTASLAAGVATLGQVFAQGDVPAGAGVLVQIGAVVTAAQVDVKTTWPDGSAKMVVLSVARPELAAGGSIDLALLRGPGASAPPIDLAAALAGHTLTVKLDVDGAGPLQFDVFDALHQALARGTVSYWQHGELATEARIELLVPNSSQRLIFDVTAFRGGGLTIDAQFNNDRAMEAVGGRVKYTVTATLDGVVAIQNTLDQAQYQNWHTTFSTTRHDGGQGLGDPDAGWLNIRQDIAKLEALNVVADYDLALRIPEATLAAYANATQQPGWEQPFAANGVEPYMPNVGGRPDLGITTAANTAWLISQDPRAAAYALGQAETASGITWQYWDAAHETWLNTRNYPYIWTAGWEGSATPGDPNAWRLSQPGEGYDTTGWAPERAHQPDLSFVPYVLTGERWMLDNVLAQAAWNVTGLWPMPRENGEAILVNGVQTRSAAWGMRQIENALLAAPDGSAEQAYFRGVSDANWKWLVSRIPELTERQGAAYGWLPLGIGNMETTQDYIAPWQQDYFASTVISAAGRGNKDALTYLNWAKNFLIGRFEHNADGFNLRDGAAYIIAAAPEGTSNWYKSWAEIGAATAAKGWSNGTGWEASGGEYGRLALSTLAGIFTYTGDSRAYDAYKALIALKPPWTTADDFARAPNYAVTIPGLYATDDGTAGAGGDPPSGGPTPPPPTGEPSPLDGVSPTNGNDTVVLSAPVLDRGLDLGGGDDRLTLASSGANRITLANVESVTGGGRDDSVTLASPAQGAVFDLLGGADQLVLSSNGANRLTIANTETVVGGTAADDVILDGDMRDATIDLGGGEDVLRLAKGGVRVSVANVEVILGGLADDDVTLRPAISGTSIDLGGGADRLTLAWNAGGRVTVAGVETVIGGDADDLVTFGSAILGGVVDLRGGGDRLVLSSVGANRLMVSNIETVTGGAQADDVTLGNAAWGSLVDLGGGPDRLTLSDGDNRMSVANVETVIGGLGNDALTVAMVLRGGTIDLRGGSDLLRLADGGNATTVIGVETITGGSGDDTITLGAPTLTAAIDLGGGRDRLVLAAGPNRIDLSNVESVTGSAGNDSLVFRTALLGGAIDLAAGSDRVELFAANSATLTGVETLIGGAGDDVLSLAGKPVLDAFVDLGGGGDRLTLATSGANRLTVLNAETVVGGGYDDVVTLGVGRPGSVDLGGGTNTLILRDGGVDVAVRNVAVVQGGGGNDRVALSSAAANAVTLSEVETILGGDLADRVTVATRLLAGVIDLGRGLDLLKLGSDAGNTVAVAGAETILGAGGDDAVTLTTPAIGLHVDLGGGKDSLQLSWTGPNTVSVSSVETILGGAGADTVRMNTSLRGGVIDLRGGSDALILSDSGSNKVTVSGVASIQGGAAADEVRLGVQPWGCAVDLAGGSDILQLGNASTFVNVRNTELVRGGTGNDVIVASGATSARLEGNAGDDRLVGGDGSDTVVGGLGLDTMRGGAGADSFLFGMTTVSPVTQPDAIEDFAPGIDRLVFTGLLRGSFEWRGTAGFTAGGHSEARIGATGWQTLVQVDVNGDGKADLAVGLIGVPGGSLGSADFAWV